LAAVLWGEGKGLSEAAGIAAVVGHQFSLFMGFRGGKGVATALGVFTALEPVITAAALVVFLAAVAATDHVSVGSMAASLAMPVILALTGGGVERVAMAMAIAGLIVVAHRENIGRLARGEERRWRRERADQERRSRRRSISSSE
jgi:acyl phosphate:glycerol-3-phosphate acyltransferase